MRVLRALCGFGISFTAKNAKKLSEERKEIELESTKLHQRHTKKMTNQEPDATENQSQDSNLSTELAKENNARIPRVEHNEGETRGNTDKPPTERRSFFWLSILFDALLFIVTCVYAFFAYHQWQAMNRQADIFKIQAEVMMKQLESMNSSSRQTDRLIQANELLAEQNRQLVEHAGEQAKAIKQSVIAAQASARAAEKGAQIAQESFYIGDRPYVIAKNAFTDELAAGASPRVTVHFVNTGKTPALDAQFYAIVSVESLPKPDLINERDVVSDSMRGLAYPSMPEGSKGVLAAGEEIQIAQGGKELSATLVQEINGGKVFLFVWGAALYKDGLGKSHTLRFCLFYDPKEDNFVACPTFNDTK